MARTREQHGNCPWHNKKNCDAACAASSVESVICPWFYYFPVQILCGMYQMCQQKLSVYYVCQCISQKQFSRDKEVVLLVALLFFRNSFLVHCHTMLRGIPVCLVTDLSSKYLKTGANLYVPDTRTCLGHRLQLQFQNL